LNHRVKNTLATVQSLAANTAREASLPDFMHETFESRLIALSRTHDHLTMSGWQSADLKSIIDAILPQPSEKRGKRIEISGPAVELTPRQGLAVAMVLNELTANAIRHGSLANPWGALKMSWTVKRRKRRPWLAIDWMEIGGLADNPPDRKGFGIRLIERSILGELSGTLDFKYKKTGLHGVIAIPLG
jgi:two-component sensor histidine kinase